MYKTIQNNQLSELMNLLYNKWFCKYRSKGVMSDEDWQECIDELSGIMEKYGEYECMKSIAFALLDEIEERDKINRLKAE